MTLIYGAGLALVWPSYDTHWAQIILHGGGVCLASIAGLMPACLLCMQRLMFFAAIVERMGSLVRVITEIMGDLK